MQRETESESEKIEAWTDLCALDDVEVGRGVFVESPEIDLAVLRVGDDEVSVLSNRCPHAGGSLASGWITEGYVVCPWHGWVFDVRTGRCPDAGVYGVRTFPARVVDGRVQAQLSVSR